jgi:phosphatidylserine/phosphatidylglycerophosphate/cardiolipin synthase-like enzyme
LAFALLLLIALSITWAIGHGVYTRAENNGAVAPSTLTDFGPYRAGMTLRETFQSFPSAGEKQTRLTLFPNNVDAWAMRWHLLAQARQTIDISYFILREDVFGAAFLGHLLQKANEGVKIRVMLDSQGTTMSFTSPTGSDWLDTLAGTRGIEVKLYRPIVSRYLEAIATANPVAAFASEHDKILVCDRKRGMIGGRNISTEYFANPKDFPKAFQDTDVALDGEQVARGLTDAFLVQFESAGAHKLDREKINLADYTGDLLLAYRAMDAWLKGQTPDPELAARIKTADLSWIEELKHFPRSRGSGRHVPEPDANAETRLLDSNTRMNAHADNIGEALMRLVHSSRKNILLVSPYLVLSDDAIHALEQAGQRGVRITLLTNSPISSDNAISQAFFQEQWPHLLARVPNLRLYVTGAARTLHSKLMVFDNQVALVGTYNLDPVSMGVNSEIMAAVWSARFADDVAALPRTQLARGAPTVYEYRIRRDRAGRAVLDKDGDPIVAFGPRDQASPEQWRKTQVVWGLLRAANKVPGMPALF